MSKYQFQQSDIYQPGTDLPINRLSIGEAEILHEIEAQLLQPRSGQVEFIIERIQLKSRFRVR